MRVFLGLFIALTLAISALAQQGEGTQFIKAQWSIGPGKFGRTPGFSLVNKNGKTIYNNPRPGNGTLCPPKGHQFTLSKGCLGEKNFRFACKAAIPGTPTLCTVKDSNGDTLGSTDGHSFEESKLPGFCSVEFPLGENIHCDPNSGGFVVS